MEIKPLNSNPPNRDRRNEDRIARLMQVSEEAVAESQQILDRVDNGLITEEEFAQMKAKLLSSIM